ncbi:MAG: UDP-glucose 4-epimerase GalE [Bacteroidia bacterium]|nr:UDP-glucose 4-epimerase GalE [Bacteroidia bacterium]
MRPLILVTGGTGYIGSHTVVELQNNGFEVAIIDNLSNSSIEVLDGIEKITKRRPLFYQFDLCEENKVNNFFKNHSVIAVIHFAAFKAVGESVAEPLKYYKNNLLSLLNLLKAMKSVNSQNMVFSSSCTVYGQPDELPVTEKAAIKKALSPYGNTKQISEEIIQDHIFSFNLFKAISLRYFNPIGAHTSAFIGELPIGIPSNLVPFITQTAIGERGCLQVFGNDYNTPDGTCIRDYINVVDLAKAHVIAVKRLIENKNKKSFEVFNLGTGKGSSVLEIIFTFEAATKQKLNYKIVDRRPGDIERVFADTRFANEELGWKAEISLQDTLLSAWNWEKYCRGKS